MELSIETFEQNFAPVLRTVGNTRMPYLIVASSDLPVFEPNEIGLLLPTNKLVLTDSEAITDMLPDSAILVKDCNEAMTKLTETTCSIAIFIGHASEALLQIANERHECKELDDKQWSFVKSYHDIKAYVRKLIDNPDFVAFCGKQLVNKTIKGLPKIEPWHTLFVSKSTHKCAMIIWDTREVVGFTKLDDAAYDLVTKCSNANDSCHMLYDRIGIADEAFEDCIAYHLV